MAIEFEIGLVDKKLINKYAGHEEQLSFKHWGMDRFRVLALEKLLQTSLQEKEIITQTLIKKYALLLKGAIKYDKMQEIHLYERKLRFLNIK